MPPESFALVTARVQPRASRDKIALQADGSLKVWCCAPPVDGEANEAVCRLIAKALQIAPSRVALVSGETSKSKRLRIDGLAAEEVMRLLSAAK